MLHFFYRFLLINSTDSQQSAEKLKFIFLNSEAYLVAEYQYVF